MSEDPSTNQPKAKPAQPADALAQTVAEMSDTELRELAGVVLGELKQRLNDPASRGLSYQHIVSDLQRRLADAHAYALSGFGRREKTRQPPPTSTPLALPLPAPEPSLSEETKARLLLDLEAELLPPGMPQLLEPAEVEAREVIAAPFEEALLIDHDEVPRNGNGAAAAGDAVTPDSFEDEIWQALQSGVGRAATPPPREDGARQ